MAKTMITVYGNSRTTIDLAMLIAIQSAKQGVKTALVELGEGNPQLCFQLGAENQRVNTTDYYILNDKSEVHVNNCLITKKDILDVYSDLEKPLEPHIKKLPDNLSLLIRKTPSDDIDISEEQYKEMIIRLRNELYEKHDLIIMAITGNYLSYPVFFSVLSADKTLVVTEDKPEDIRGLNTFMVEMSKISNIEFKSVFLNYGTDITADNFKNTKFDVISTLKLKSLQKLRMTALKAYDEELPEIEELLNVLLDKEVKGGKRK